MIENINTNPHPIELGAQLNQPDSGHALPDNDTDVSVQVDHANLIKKALQIPQSNTKDLSKIKEALLSGELDCPANIFEAAQNLYNYGV